MFKRNQILGECLFTRVLGRKRVRILANIAPQVQRLTDEGTYQSCHFCSRLILYRIM